jgi:hypothetical protein
MAGSLNLEANMASNSRPVKTQIIALFGYTFSVPDQVVIRAATAYGSDSVEARLERIREPVRLIKFDW